MTNILDAMAIWRPCNTDAFPQAGEFGINSKMLATRVALVFASYLYCVGIRESLRNPFLGMWVVIWSLSVCMVETIRVGNKVQTTAVARFVDELAIDPAVMAYIERFPVTAKRLPSCSPEQASHYLALLKTTFIRAQPNDPPSEDQLQLFKILIDKGTPLDFDTIMQILSEDSPSFATYALEKGSIKAKNLSPKKQLKCWTLVTDNHVACLLKENGFKINIDVNGVTPLKWALSHCHSATGFRVCQVLVRNRATVQEGELWKNVCTGSFESHFCIFKELADELFKDAPLEKRQELFVDAVRGGQREFVYYLLQNKIQASECPAFECWKAVTVPKVSYVLSDGGIDVNARNEAGFTPLLDFLSQPNLNGDERKFDYLALLLANKANIHAHVMVSETGPDEEIVEKRVTVYNLLENAPNKTGLKAFFATRIVDEV